MNRKEFLESFENSNESMSLLYNHIFSCMEHDELESLLLRLKESVIKKDWFYDFHKSMRQTDFINNVHVIYYTNNQTQSDIEEMEKLKTILPMHKEKGTIWSDIVKREEAINKGLVSEMNRYSYLKSLKKVENRRSIGGHLDMILWNTIHLDVNNFLEKHIETIFKN
jgi:hypothetical protein